ncbi:endonuclease/exonuclease/phosphatase family protein [Lentisphaerota bacterium WC36G]|nr:endonuclease/exonuclease/phosphatase family protein [Lentisphaerae bacterium WC36]
MSLLKKIITHKINFMIFIYVALVITLLSSLIGYFGKYHWFLDLFAHFKMQYFILTLCFLTILIVAFFLRKRKKKNSKALIIFTILTCFTLLINFLEIFPLYVAPPSSASDNSAKKIIKLMHFNINTANNNYNQIENYILANNPDIVLLEEVNSSCLLALKQLEKKYPFKITYPQEDNFGIAMFSKFKMTSANLLYYGSRKIPYIRAEYLINGKNISIFGVHTLPPIGANLSKERNEMLAYLAKKIDSSQSTIILGDLNISPFSYYFKKLLKDGNLTNSQCGFGLQTSWPAKLFLLRIPIDHCLISNDIQIIDRKIGSNIGSDHNSLIISLKF